MPKPLWPIWSIVTFNYILNRLLAPSVFISTAGTPQAGGDAVSTAGHTAPSAQHDAF